MRLIIAQSNHPRLPTLSGRVADFPYLQVVRRIARKEISPSYLGKARFWCQDPPKIQLSQPN